MGNNTSKGKQVVGAPVVAAAAAAPPPPVEILWDYENVPVRCLLGYRDALFI